VALEYSELGQNRRTAGPCTETTAQGIIFHSH